jgi:hypothetical protein
MLNRTELRCYRLTDIVSLPIISFQFSSSSSLSLAFVMYTFSARLLQTSHCWQALR